MKYESVEMSFSRDEDNSLIISVAIDSRPNTKKQFDMSSSHRDIAKWIHSNFSRSDTKKVNIRTYQGIRTINGVIIDESIKIENFDETDFEGRPFNKLSPKFYYAVMDGNQNHERERPIFVTNDKDEAIKKAKALNYGSANSHYFATEWNQRENASEYVRDLSPIIETVRESI